jgi:hypothetical protein
MAEDLWEAGTSLLHVDVSTRLNNNVLFDGKEKQAEKQAKAIVALERSTNYQSSAVRVCRLMEAGRRGVKLIV